MALIKDHLTAQGVNGTYHRIVKVELFAATESLQVTVAIYATAEARQAGGLPLWHEYVVLPLAALTCDPRDSIYPLLVGYWNSYVKDAQPDQVPPEPSAIELLEAATQPPPPPPAPPPPETGDS